MIGAGIYLILTFALAAAYGAIGAVIADTASRLIVTLLLIFRFIPCRTRRGWG